MSKRKLNQEKKIIRAELEKEYRTKLREAKKIMACAKVEKNLRISVVAPSVSLYFGNKRVNSKGPYPVEKARNLIREKVLPELHIFTSYKTRKSKAHLALIWSYGWRTV